MSDDIVENLKQPSQWLRIAFMLALAVALYVAGLVLSLLTVAQALFSLFTGSDNANLRALGKDLAMYVQQILAFLTYNSEFKPFPFAPYLDSEDALTEPGEVQQEIPVAAQPTPANKKPAAKKTASPKPAAKPKIASSRRPAVKKSAALAKPPDEITED